MIYKEIKVGNNNATLYCYLLDGNISFNETQKWPCIIIVPGGAYLFTSTKEGESVATKFLGAAYSCFVLRYNTKVKNRVSRELNENFCYPDPSVELLEAMHIIHENADKWHIDIDHMYINGYSAGAHIALTAILRGDEDFIKNRLSFTPVESEFTIKGLILGYPMISVHLMDIVIKSALLNKSNPTKNELKPLDMSLYLAKATCPMFIWQTATDKVVNPPALCHFVGQALELGISIEFHLFKKGPHGLAMADERYAKNQEDINHSVALWFDLVLHWMNEQ